MAVTEAGQQTSILITLDDIAAQGCDAAVGRGTTKLKMEDWTKVSWSDKLRFQL